MKGGKHTNQEHRKQHKTGKEKPAMVSCSLFFLHIKFTRARLLQGHGAAHQVLPLPRYDQVIFARSLNRTLPLYYRNGSFVQARKQGACTSINKMLSAYYSNGRADLERRWICITFTRPGSGECFFFPLSLSRLLSSDPK